MVLSSLIVLLSLAGHQVHGHDTGGGGRGDTAPVLKKEDVIEEVDNQVGGQGVGRKGSIRKLNTLKEKMENVEEKVGTNDAKAIAGFGNETVTRDLTTLANWVNGDFDHIEHEAASILSDYYANAMDIKEVIDLAMEKDTMGAIESASKTLAGHAFGKMCGVGAAALVTASTGGVGAFAVPATIVFCAAAGLAFAEFLDFLPTLFDDPEDNACVRYNSKSGKNLIARFRQINSLLDKEVNEPQGSCEDLYDDNGDLQSIELYFKPGGDNFRYCFTELSFSVGWDKSGTGKDRSLLFPMNTFYYILKKAAAKKGVSFENYDPFAREYYNCMRFGTGISEVSKFHFDWAKAMMCQKFEYFNTLDYSKCFEYAMLSVGFKPTYGGWGENHNVDFSGWFPDKYRNPYKQVRSASNQCWQASGSQNGNLIEITECQPKQSQLFAVDNDGRIRSQLNPTMCVEANKDATLHKQLYLWDCNGEPWQQWYFHNDGRIQNSHHRMYIGTADCNPSNQPVLRYFQDTGTCNDAQKWEWIEMFHQIRSGKDANFCMDVKDGGTDNGNHVHIWDCKEGKHKPNQQFFIDNLGRIRTVLNPNKCVEAGAINTLYKKLYIWDCHGEPWQQWTFQDDGRIVNKHHGMYIGLAYDSSEHGKRLELRNKEDDNLAHYWVSSPSVNVRSGKDANFCMDVKEGKTDNGNPVQLWGCDSTNRNQKFFIGHDGHIRTVLNPNKCVEAGAINTLYKKLYIWDCHGEPWKQWTFQDDGRIVNRHHGMYIGLAYDSSEQGNELELRNKEDDNLAHRWKIDEYLIDDLTVLKPEQLLEYGTFAINSPSGNTVWSSRAGIFICKRGERCSHEKLVASDDSYIRGGTYKDDNFGGESSMVVSTFPYLTRKSLLRMSSTKKKCHYSLNLFVDSSYIRSTTIKRSTTMTVRLLDHSNSWWDQNTVTWSNFALPSYEQTKELEITSADNKQWVKLDVTELVSPFMGLDINDVNPDSYMSNMNFILEGKYEGALVRFGTIEDNKAAYLEGTNCRFGFIWYPGQRIFPSKVAFLSYKDDGNLVIYKRDASGWNSVWASNTVRSDAGYAKWDEEDGNFKLYNENDEAYWSTNIQNNGVDHGKPIFRVHDDGTFVIYSPSGNPVWSSGDELKLKSLGSVEDSYIRGGTYAQTNFGGASNVVVKNDSSLSYTRKSLLKFQALREKCHYSLNLFVGSVSSEPITVNVRILDNNTWEASTVTWSSFSIPSSEETKELEITSADDKQWVKVDVTELLAPFSDGDIVSFVLDGKNKGAWVGFGTIESDKGAYLESSNCRFGN